MQYILIQNYNKTNNHVVNINVLDAACIATLC
jgi:hypothetical protein